MAFMREGGPAVETDGDDVAAEEQSSGATNTALSVALFAALVAAFTLYRPAAGLAFAAGAVNGYVLNRLWTFATRDTGAARLRYGAAQAGDLVSNGALVGVLVEAGAGRLGATSSPCRWSRSRLSSNRAWTFQLPAPA
jgi:hypothetical protein